MFIKTFLLRQRLEKENSFIFNGLDDRNLILIPENFSNSNCFVSNEIPIHSDGEECQVFINQNLIDKLLMFFQDLKLDKKVENFFFTKTLLKHFLG